MNQYTNAEQLPTTDDLQWLEIPTERIEVDQVGNLTRPPYDHENEEIDLPDGVADLGAARRAKEQAVHSGFAISAQPETIDGTLEQSTRLNVGEEPSTRLGRGMLRLVNGTNKVGTRVHQASPVEKKHEPLLKPNRAKVPLPDGQTHREHHRLLGRQDKLFLERVGQEDRKPLEKKTVAVRGSRTHHTYVSAHSRDLRPSGEVRAIADTQRHRKAVDRMSGGYVSATKLNDLRK